MTNNGEIGANMFQWQHLFITYHIIHHADVVYTNFSTEENLQNLFFCFPTKAIEAVTAESDFVTIMPDAKLEKFKETKKNLLSSFQRYRRYYDQKSFAQLEDSRSQHQPEDVELIDATKVVMDLSLVKYRSKPWLFYYYLPKLLEEIQQQTNDNETTQSAPTTARLSIPSAQVAVAFAPIFAPLPTPLAVPPPDPPPDTVPEPLAPPQPVSMKASLTMI